jgi:hypothetical protein
MKKKGNKKGEEKKEEKPVDQKNLMEEINQYLKISENETKLREKEKEKENEEFQKLKIKNDAEAKEIEKLQANKDIEELFKKAFEMVIELIIDS